MTRACLVLFALVAIFGLAGCYEANTLVVERNDDQFAAELAGDYYGFDDLPLSVADWRAYRDKWKTKTAISRDPHLGEYFFRSENRDGGSNGSGVGRVAVLRGTVIIAQLFGGTPETFVLVLRRDANGTVRAMKIEPSADAALRQRHGFQDSGLFATTADRARSLAYLNEAAALPGTTWPILLVPTRLVER